MLIPAALRPTALAVARRDGTTNYFDVDPIASNTGRGTDSIAQTRILLKLMTGMSLAVLESALERPLDVVIATRLAS